MIYLTKELCEQALLGGLLLGGGGGGTLTAGREALEETFKHTDKLTMLDVSELKPDDVVVNVSTLGAPSAKDVHLTAEHWMTALKNFELNYGKKIAGFTSCENGAISTANGWVISAQMCIRDSLRSEAVVKDGRVYTGSQHHADQHGEHQLRISHDNRNTNRKNHTVRSGECSCGNGCLQQILSVDTAVFS